MRAERGAQAQLADLVASLAAARARIASLTARYSIPPSRVYRRKIFHSALKSIQTKVEAVVNIKYEDDDVVEVVNGPSKEESTTSEVKSETVSEESNGETDVKIEDSWEEAIKIEDTKVVRDTDTTENMDLDDKE